MEKLKTKYPEWQPWLGHVPPLEPPPKPFLEKKRQEIRQVPASNAWHKAQTNRMETKPERAY